MRINELEFVLKDIEEKGLKAYINNIKIDSYYINGLADVIVISDNSKEAVGKFVYYISISSITEIKGILYTNPLNN